MVVKFKVGKKYFLYNSRSQKEYYIVTKINSKTQRISVMQVYRNDLFGESISRKIKNTFMNGDEYIEISKGVSGRVCWTGSKTLYAIDSV